jgi:DNA-directed RNA polymerase subunit omega
MRDETSLASEVLEKIPNKYMAVIVSSRRAKAINAGGRPLVKSNATKPTTVALEEIAEGLVVPDETTTPEVEEEQEVELLSSSDAEPIFEAELVAEVDTETEDLDEEE